MCITVTSMLIDDSNARYDRQLRLWGIHGQRRLASMRVMVLGSSVAATETLRNLVLPGIGHFTIVDDALVSTEDLGRNFFLEECDMNQPRASCVVRHLKELNPDVIGASLIQSASCLPSDDLVSEFDFIILADSNASYCFAASLCEVCKRLDRGFIFVRSRAMIGTVRIYVQQHPIVESKPDAESHQLWVAEPFPELQKYCEGTELNGLSDVEHAHVPFIVLLVQACGAFRNKNNGALPTFNDIDIIKNWIEDNRRSPNEQNFAEATRNARIACQPVVLPSTVLDILHTARNYSIQELIRLWITVKGRKRGAELLREKFCFWVTARAVAKFVDLTGKPPCAGTLPDLTSSSERFIALQQIYQEKCKQDVEVVSNHVNSILEQLDSASAVEIRKAVWLNGYEYVERFCRNILDCRVVRIRTMAEEISHPIPEAIREALLEEIENHRNDEEEVEKCAANDSCRTVLPKSCPLSWHILWQATEAWNENYRHEESNDRMQKIMKGSLIPSILDRMGLKPPFSSLSNDLYSAMSLLSSYDLELHATASIVASIAAQEAIKICTGQFLPLNNTFIWDGYASKGCTVEL